MAKGAQKNRVRARSTLHQNETIPASSLPHKQEDFARKREDDKKNSQAENG